jgi:protein TonB
MGKFLIVISFFLISYVGFTQDSIQKIKEDEKEIYLDEVPVFPGCKRKKTEEKKRKCMSDKVSRFISKKYNVEIFEDLNFPDGKHIVYIIFKIDKEGNVVQAIARGPHPLLEQEAVRVINSLPQVIPGKVKGKPVIIPFSIPIYLSNIVTKSKKATR